MRRVVVLRPEPGAAETAKRARELGLDVVAIPLFDVVPVHWQAPDPHDYDGLLLTSANAIRHGGEQLESLRPLPVYAVGEATASEARAAGFGISVTGDGGVDQLLSSIETNLRLLHLCGADRRASEQPRQAITPLVVYRAVECEDSDLSAAVESVVLTHSPRAAARFAELVPDRGAIAVAAISEAAARAVGDGWEGVAIADQPTDQALLALAARLCNNSQPK